jgi:hypothetical protein
VKWIPVQAIADLQLRVCCNVIVGHKPQGASVRRDYARRNSSQTRMMIFTGIETTSEAGLH